MCCDSIEHLSPADAGDVTQTNEECDNIEGTHTVLMQHLRPDKPQGSAASAAAAPAAPAAPAAAAGSLLWLNWGSREKEHTQTLRATLTQVKVHKSQQKILNFVIHRRRRGRGRRGAAAMPGTFHFEAPELADNPDGWGPTTVPEHFKDVPYAPFNKGDKLGKASDWTGQAYKYGQGEGLLYLPTTPPISSSLWSALATSACLVTRRQMVGSYQ